MQQKAGAAGSHAQGRRFQEGRCGCLGDFRGTRRDGLATCPFAASGGLRCGQASSTLRRRSASGLSWLARPCLQRLHIRCRSRSSKRRVPVSRPCRSCKIRAGRTQSPSCQSHSPQSPTGVNADGKRLACGQPVSAKLDAEPETAAGMRKTSNVASTHGHFTALSGALRAQRRRLRVGWFL